MLKVPWLIALAGLATPLVVSEFQLWTPVTFWLVVLGMTWVLGQTVPTPREGRILLAVALIPVLFQAGFLGGWWLLPANLASLSAEWRARSRRNPQPADSAS